MPPNQTIVHSDEKSALLESELVNQALVEEHYRTGPYDTEAGRRRHPRGRCARLCKAFFWMVFGMFALTFFLRHSNRHFDLSNFWCIGSPKHRPMALSQCHSAPIAYKDGELNYVFDVNAESKPSSFFFGQHYSRKSHDGPGFGFIQTAGRVIIQEAPEGADPVTVSLRVHLSHEELRNAISIKHDATGLTFESDRIIQRLGGVRPCIEVLATISIAPSTNISSFNIDTIVLPIELKESLKLNSHNTFIRSVSGGVTSGTDALYSRKIEIETTSGSITGSYPLADLLSLKTISGTVQVNIDPKDSDKSDHNGVLIIRGVSGTIHADTITTSIPSRTFNTQVHSRSGSISGTYLLGDRTTIESNSGTVTVDIYTAGDLAKRVLTIDTVSGSIRSCVYDTAAKLGAVSSVFMTRSGTMQLQYPGSWEGKIQAQTLSGSLSVTGEGVDIIKDVHPKPGFKQILAEKGDGDSNISAENTSGSISVRIG
ncbi:hypothetical protein BT63DRAFT_236518 [Microthyrium microscopicum]|uniref:Adhesin domain-containing protein n=1 Tax=Microthyrium microscopicum TaxID=703497 RepID=A0A6A6UDM0_9PEZI|nr:hypothetical protein BT63DRAFT_236518 [Microthyrium microscopicum]